MSNSEIAQLYATEYRGLVAYLNAAFGTGPPEPEDVAQRAFMQLAARGDLSDIRNPRSFLRQIARNLMISGFRAETTRRGYERSAAESAIEGVESTPQRVLEGNEELVVIMETLDRMPHTRRRAMILHRFDGLNLADVGRRLGISRTAAAKHVARAMQAIDAALAKAHRELGVTR
ncbi:MAG: RNA polymerase sigma factor [Pseudomonadota bacterium]